MSGEAGAVVEVGVDPGTAFDLFTGEAGAWWQRSLWGEAGAMRFEPGVGGRLLLTDQGEREVGRVLVWEPGPRLVFSYGPAGGEEGERARVEVRFEATERGTRVVLRHSENTGNTGRTGPWAGVLASFARHSHERMLLHRLGEFLDAIAAGDAGFFERNLTEDALMIFPGPGNIYTKAQCVKEMGNHPPYVKYDIADQRIVHIGESTAVLSHRATIQNTAYDAPRTVMVSNVLVREDDDWRLALHQWTPAGERGE